MTASIPEIEPLEIIAGDYLQWKRVLTDYPATAGWVLSYTFINSTHKITITASASGGDHLVTVISATSLGYASGVYRWQAVVTLAGVVHVVGTGELTVKPNFAAATTLDTRSTVKVTLDAINAEITARLSGGMTQEYTIGNRSLKKEPMTELLKLRDKYAAAYASEQNSERVGNGLAGKNRILVRF